MKRPVTCNHPEKSKQKKTEDVSKLETKAEDTENTQLVRLHLWKGKELAFQIQDPSSELGKKKCLA